MQQGLTDWLESLTSKDRECFLAFCKNTSTPTLIYIYARFLGYTGSIVDCDKWSQKKFKKRNFRIVLETEIDAMQEDIANLREGIKLSLIHI